MCSEAADLQEHLRREAHEAESSIQTQVFQTYLLPLTCFVQLEEYLHPRHSLGLSLAGISVREIGMVHAGGILCIITHIVMEKPSED